LHELLRISQKNHNELFHVNGIGNASTPDLYLSGDGDLIPWEMADPQ